MDIFGDGRGANQQFGSFTITDLLIDYTGATPTLVRFSATFVQHAESPSAPPLTGSIEYNLTDTRVEVIEEQPDEGTDTVLSDFSYTLPDTERFQLLGSKGEIEASPCFGYGDGVAISYRATLDGETRIHVNPVVDQFAGETAYFSDCILRNEAPEPDGEEGWRDVRVIAAI